MHQYQARVTWKRQDAKFTDNRYSRGHEWSFDGGVTVPASSSPASVPLPLSIAQAVDPEEALVAAASSCHMLWFLSLAARRGFVVDAYTDEAFGVIGKDENGKQFITRVTLRPKIEFSGAKMPSTEELEALHHAAHEECFIANSLKSEVLIESVPG
ncbi:MAG: OsmC family protein [Gammaproteobacteria bacterium]|nr:OsmC family protein [Gammaproteobacteria bacterium]